MAKMHADEFEIDVALVQRLLSEQFPDWAGLSIRQVSSIGTDNALYRLGENMVVRLPRIDWAVADVDKECTWLPKIAPFLPISIPIPLVKGSPTKYYPWSWSVYSWLEGMNPTVGSLSDPHLFANDLADFISALHKIDLLGGPISSRGIPLKQKQNIGVHKALDELKGMIDGVAALKIWEKTTQAPFWNKSPVWVHGDLSPGNLLTQNGRLSGVIDFGNLGIGDPACDLIVAWNFLPRTVRDAFRKKLKVDDATWERGRGWALSIALIQLPYYKDTNPMLANNARHVIAEILKEGAS